MNRIVVVLLIILVALSVTCGFLFYRNNELLNQNNKLLNQNNELQNQANGLLEQNSQLNNQNTVLLNQTNDLQEQNNGLLTQNNALQSQLSGLQNQINDCENQTTELQTQIDELEQQNFELQNQTNELTARYTNLVKITDFSIRGGLLSPSGTGYASVAEITIKNFGTNDVEGLRLWVNYTSLSEINPDDIGYYTSVQELNPIAAGEARNLIANVVWHTDYGKNFVATLLLYDVIIDQYYYT